MLLWQLFCILLGSSFFTGDVWSRSGSHCRPPYLVISSLWGFIGLWALVGCSCGQWLENSCSKCWKSHRNYCSWRAGTPPSLHEWCIFGMYFLKWTNWLNSMNVSSHSCELSVSVTTPLSLHILPNAAACSGFCEDWHWSSAVPQLHIFIVVGEAYKSFHGASTLPSLQWVSWTSCIQLM